jgi:deazaflavin-dependent oxidoreductase (nitroreductase family)
MADQQFIRALDASSEVELTVTGRTSGPEITIPVWFVREGDTLYLVPVNGSDSDWYKNVLERPTIRVSARNAHFSARAAPITEYGSDDVAAYYPKHDVAAEAPLA